MLRVLIYTAKHQFLCDIITLQYSCPIDLEVIAVLIFTFERDHGLVNAVLHSRSKGLKAVLSDGSDDRLDLL